MGDWIFYNQQNQKLINCSGDFWKHFPESPENFAKCVKGRPGIAVSVNLDYCRGDGLQKKYGSIETGILLKLLDEWGVDRIAFTKKYSPDITSAMQKFEQDNYRDKIKADKELKKELSGLPAPPKGYYWVRVKMGLITCNNLGFQNPIWMYLWSKNLGYGSCALE